MPDRVVLGRLGSVVSSLVVLMGCQSLGVPLPIPTDPPSPICNTGLFMPLTLAGDKHSDPAVWGVQQNGVRLNIVWPNGWTAHEDQGGTTIVIADDSGKVVARTGDVITNAGGGGTNDEAHICSIG